MSSSNGAYNVPNHIVDDLCMRFLDSVPDEHRKDDIRIFFEIEMAHWFYLDNYCENETYHQCKPIKFRRMCHQIYERCHYLMKRKKNVEHYLDNFHRYKQKIPTNGAILIDQSLEYVLLVRGYQNNATWGFPKGKVNEAEPPVNCAIREIEEEVGYDISEVVNAKLSVSRFINKAVIQLFLVTGVPLDSKFKPNVNKEIGKIQWFRLDCLPLDKNDEECYEKIGMRANKFYNVSIFMNEILTHVKKLKMRRAKKAAKQMKAASVPGTSFTGLSFMQMIESASESRLGSASNSVNSRNELPTSICVFVDEKTKRMASTASENAIDVPKVSDSNISLPAVASEPSPLSVRNHQTVERRSSTIPEDPHNAVPIQDELLLLQASNMMRRFFNIKQKPLPAEQPNPLDLATLSPDSPFAKLFPHLSTTLQNNHNPTIPCGKSSKPIFY